MPKGVIDKSLFPSFFKSVIFGTTLANSSQTPYAADGNMHASILRVISNHASRNATAAIKPMKFVLSFLVVTTVLSAGTCFKLNLGNAALTPENLCSQDNALSHSTPLKCEPVTQQLTTQSTIKCDLPNSKPAPEPIVSKCTPVPVECPKHDTPIIDKSRKCGDPDPGNPDPRTSSVATPEPASYALLGAGLVTAGLARRLRKKVR